LFELLINTDGRLRQCVDHPLLVMSKSGEDEADADKLLDEEGSGEQSVKELIAGYAGGSGTNSSGVDQAYALQVLKELGEAESTPECAICFGEVSDEVLLPCFHRT